MTKPRSWRRLVPMLGFTVALGLGVVPLTAAPALACSCVGGSDETFADRADVVFVGRVDEAMTSARSARFVVDEATGARSARFVVDEVFKGDVHAYTDVVTASDGAACGLDFVRGDTMVVFAQYGSDGLTDAGPEELTANLCNGTRSIGVAEFTLTAGHAPIVGASESAGAGFPILGWLSLLAVAGLGALPVALWLRLRGQLDRPKSESATSDLA